jgi:hypothetical protein
MKLISDSVGTNGANKISDVALVQAILLKITRPATRTTPAAPYLTSYDGDCGKNTKDAIRAFQDDRVFISADGRACAPNPQATAGVVKPADATWQKLLEAVDPKFSDMRVLDGGKTVYLAATQEQLTRRINAVAGLTFAPAFRHKVIACINRMYELYGIAIGVCRQGDRRTFQAQYDLLVGGNNVTHAGPGESNHNFGMAVDLGFEGLRWLKKHGAVTENETSWFHILNPNQNVIGPEAMRFWKALRAVGTSPTVGTFRGPESDRPHLQNWDDAGVDMATRLADLLTRSGKMRWRGAHQAYQCDLGFGCDFYTVGSARKIWNRQATVTIHMLTQARAAHLAAVGVGVGAGQPPGPPAPPPPFTSDDVVSMQQALRRDFEAAEANWQNWTPN